MYITYPRRQHNMFALASKTYTSRREYSPLQALINIIESRDLNPFIYYTHPLSVRIYNNTPSPKGLYTPW